MPQLTLRQVPNTTAGGFFFWQLVKTGVCTENLIRFDDAMESPKLAE
jgi:hypothetical protein